MLYRKHDQTEFGILGNCVQAAIATIIGAEKLDDVPNFILDGNGEPTPPTLFWEKVDDFLTSKGLVNMIMGNNFIPECVHLASGKTNRGLMHMVVRYENKIIHDPHPSRDGIISVDYTHLIVPMDLSKFILKDTARDETGNISRL